jgi:dihydropteroate synthase
VREVVDELATILAAAIAAGIDCNRIVLDPGIGFAKTAEHSVVLLRHLTRFVQLGHPVLVGVSRKSFVGQLSGEKNPACRLGGSLAASLFAISQGASIIRVHDVFATTQAVRVWHSLS